MERRTHLVSFLVPDALSASCDGKAILWLRPDPFQEAERSFFGKVHGVLSCSELAFSPGELTWAAVKLHLFKQGRPGFRRRRASKVHLVFMSDLSFTRRAEPALRPTKFGDSFENFESFQELLTFSLTGEGNMPKSR